MHNGTIVARSASCQWVGLPIDRRCESLTVGNELPARGPAAIAVTLNKTITFRPPFARLSASPPKRERHNIGGSVDHTPMHCRALTILRTPPHTGRRTKSALRHSDATLASSDGIRVILD